MRIMEVHHQEVSKLALSSLKLVYPIKEWIKKGLLFSY